MMEDIIAILEVSNLGSLWQEKHSHKFNQGMNHGRSNAISLWDAPMSSSGSDSLVGQGYVLQVE